MPELPEVEHLRRTLAPLLEGRRVVRARLLRRDVCSPCRAGAAALLQGATLLEPLRHGKVLAIPTKEGPAVGVHLGMTGQLRIEPDNTPDHVHARWELDDGRRLVFRDPRRFGGLWCFPSLDALRDALWRPLGPDALAIAADALAPRLARTRRCIKAALLDQRVLAGVGNIYADESLFRAQISPLRRADRLHPRELEALARTIRTTLTAAIDAGGSTLRDYVDAAGNAGRQQRRHLVYGRAGQPCTRCGRPLRAVTLGQRTTVYCPRCQPRRVVIHSGELSPNDDRVPGPFLGAGTVLESALCP